MGNYLLVFTDLIILPSQERGRIPMDMRAPGSLAKNLSSQIMVKLTLKVMWLDVAW